MKCPKCGGFSEVIDSRPGKNRVRRRRRCVKATCSHRWTTVEFEAQRVVSYVPRPAGPTHNR